MFLVFFELFFYLVRYPPNFKCSVFNLFWFFIHLKIVLTIHILHVYAFIALLRLFFLHLSPVLLFSFVWCCAASVFVAIVVVMMYWTTILTLLIQNIMKRNSSDYFVLYLQLFFYINRILSRNFNEF